MRRAPIALTEPLAPNRHAASCAGHGCEQREGCARYVRKPASFKQKWASFDIERQWFKGDCRAFEKIS